jgi:hypothetical protein
MRGAVPSLPQYVFMAWCLVKHRDNFTSTFTICNANMVAVRIFQVGAILELRDKRSRYTVL